MLRTMFGAGLCATRGMRHRLVHAAPGPLVRDLCWIRIRASQGRIGDGRMSGRAPLVSHTEIAALLGCQPRRVLRMIDHDVILGFRDGRRGWVSVDADGRPLLPERAPTLPPPPTERSCRTSSVRGGRPDGRADQRRLDQALAPRGRAAKRTGAAGRGAAGARVRAPRGSDPTTDEGRSP